MKKDKLPKLNLLEQAVADMVLKRSKLSYLRGYNAGLDAAKSNASIVPSVEKEIRDEFELIIAKHQKKIM